MRWVKWLLAVYLVVVVALAAAIAVAAAFSPRRQLRPDTLYTALGANLKTLDPATINDTTGSAIAGNIFECLYNYKYGQKDPYEVFPELAAAMPTVSADGRTYTIPLRKGIHFYDPDRAVWPDGRGPEVTARDVIYSWKRVADFNLASPLYSQVFEGRIVGLEDWWGYTKQTPPERIDWDRPVEGLKAPDDYTLQIILTTPYPQFLYNLAYLPTAVVSRDVVRKYGDRINKRPIGTGPYTLPHELFLEDQRLTLVANPIYRGRPDVDGTAVLKDDEKLPHIKRLQLDYFKENLPVWLLFQQGYFDIGGIPKETFHQAITDRGTLSPAMKQKGVVLNASPEAATYYYGFNWDDPVVGGPKHAALRQAMSMAFDRQTYVTTFLNGRGMPAIGPIPPGFPTFDPEQTNPYTRFDLDAARAKMKEAERVNGGPIPPLSLVIGSTDTDARQEGEFFTRQMAQVGVRVNVEYRSWARFQEVVDKKEAQLFGLGWVADYPDEQDFFQLFYGPNGGANGTNPTNYVNKTFDKIYEGAVVMSPSPQRQKLYKQMSQIVMDDCPWLLTFYPKAYTLYYDWLGDLQAMDYGYGMRQYDVLNATLRAERLGRH